MSELPSSAQVTATLGALDLKFERTSAPNESPLWNLSFNVDDDVVVLTLYIASGWLVALHAINRVVSDEAAAALLELNSRLLGARIAVGPQRNAMVLGDLSLNGLSPPALSMMLLATVAAARLASSKLAGVEGST